MVDKARLEELLEHWEDMREQGQHVSPDELCRDCPELLDELRQRIRRVEWVDRLLDPAAGGGHDGQPEIEQAELPRTLGRYRLDNVIGEGGFGQVWKAYDPELDRLVAIKVLRRERHRSVFQVARFVDEAKKVAKLRHPNIVSVYDFGREGGYYYFVADLIAGTNLGERMEQGKLPASAAMNIVAKIADALHHAHQRGIIHRDVKPKNILLDERGEPFITDFGIAVTEDALLADGPDRAGTPAYMSPEQAATEGPPIDQRTDIYSLGVVLYELLVGKRPLEAATVQILRDKLLASPPPNPRSVDRSIPAAVSKVCMKALAVPPVDRWATAEGFAAALRAAAAGPRTGIRLAAGVVVVALSSLLLFAVVRPLVREGLPLDSDPVPIATQSTASKPAEQRPGDSPQTVSDTVVYPPVRQRLTVDAMTYLTEFARGLSPIANTGIIVGQGQTVDVKAWGTWGCGPERGKETGPEWLFVAIGQARQPPFEHYRVGEFIRFQAQQSGLLFLGTSDSTTDDNTGTMTAEVTVYSGSAPSAPAPSAIQLRPLLWETPLLGRDMPGCRDERDDGPSGSLLVGINVTEGILQGFRDHTMVESLQPVYLKDGQLIEGQVFGECMGEVRQLRAKDGYAIGAFQVNHCISGLRPRYVRITSQGLDTQDAYWGEWVGGEPYEYAPVVCSFGRRIVGLNLLSNKHLGVTHRHVKAIGLILEPDGRTADTLVAGRVFNVPGFRDQVAGNGYLVGLRLSRANNENQPSLITSVQPLYAVGSQLTEGRIFGQPTGEITEFRARNGFAVGAIKLFTGERVERLQLIYMRASQQGLDLTDTYADDWYGTSGIDEPSILGGDGRPIVGLIGVADSNIHALGLMELGTSQVFAAVPYKEPEAKKTEPSDLLLYMTFDEGTVRNHEGRLIVDDLSGAGNHGVGEDVEVVPDGVRGNALKFVPRNPQASEGFVRLPRVLLNKRREYTVVFWVYRDIAENNIAYWESTPEGGDVCGVMASTFMNSWNGSGRPDVWKGNKHATLEPLPLAQWSFLAAVFKADDGIDGKVRVFVDEKAFDVDSHIVDSPRLGYGKLRGKSGSVDELRIYSRAFSDDEVRILYDRDRAELARNAK